MPVCCSKTPRQIDKSTIAGRWLTVRAASPDFRGGLWCGAITNAYDAVGNRTSHMTGFNFQPADSNINQSFGFDHRDLIDSDSVPNNANSNYDANGNTLVSLGVPTDASVRRGKPAHRAGRTFK